MAEVYKAYQPGLDRYVGIKVLHSHLVDDADFIGRFEREALAIGKLRHPSIVQALDFDREGDLYFMAMEYIDGPTLKDELKARRAANNPFTYEEISRIFTALCSAIDYAHSRGMVHRDIKPANVMINQDGQIVLTDFGIARIVGATQFTQTGALAGTPAYMSPEQGQGERGDERSDIYSLGVMLYEMVTGAVPYDADTPFAVIMQHINQPLPLPTKINPDIPETIERVILKAMGKNPDDRYQTAGEMARDLRDAVGLAPDDTLHSTPLKTVASPPKVQQIDHPTGPLSSREKVATAVGAGQEGSTVLSSETGAPARGVPVLPLVIGGVVILILILVGVVGAILISRPPTPPPTPTADLAAIAAVTQTSEANNNAATTATANAIASATADADADVATAAAIELAGPTQTAQAAANISNTATAQFEQQSSIFQSLQATSQASTAEAATADAAAADAATADAAAADAAAADAATAEYLANVTPTPEPTATPIPTDTPTLGPPPDTPTPVPPAAPTDTPTPERPQISGKLAFPVDNGSGRYDVRIVSMPEGNALARIDGARQPHFRQDGTKLLVNAQGGGFGENVFEASATGNIERPVSGSPTDSYPTYDTGGNRVTYSNPQLAIGTDGNYHSYIFVQCGLIPPQQENDQNCKDIARFGILVPAGQIGEIQGSNPVWTSTDQIVYKGCNSWAGGQSCGLFIVGSWANKRSSDGETPRKIADGTSLIPTDTKGNLVVYHSRQTGDWEAYVMDVNGGGVINLSNNPTSNDGVPTISPDGQWVVFASDRDGAWAVFVVPSRGGPVTKLFDFPKANPWGVGGDREWTNERMSWGP
jgi:hypothetical protein